MVTLTWLQLAALVFGTHIGSALANIIRDYRRTCPRRRMLPLSQIEVRCFNRLHHGRCTEHGQVR
jgi:hypothetical protein